MSANPDIGFATFLGTALGKTVYREDNAPQDQREPYATYERLSTESIRALKRVTTLAMAIYRVALYSTNPNTAETMEGALWAALDGYRGTMGTTKVQLAQVDNISTRMETPTDGNQPRVHVREFDVTLWFQRTGINR